MIVLPTRLSVFKYTFLCPVGAHPRKLWIPHLRTHAKHQNLYSSSQQTSQVNITQGLLGIKVKIAQCNNIQKYHPFDPDVKRSMIYYLHVIFILGYSLYIGNFTVSFLFRTDIKKLQGLCTIQQILEQRQNIRQKCHVKGKHFHVDVISGNILIKTKIYL